MNSLGERLSACIAGVLTARLRRLEKKQRWRFFHSPACSCDGQTGGIFGTPSEYNACYYFVFNLFNIICIPLAGVACDPVYPLLVSSLTGNWTQAV